MRAVESILLVVTDGDRTRYQGGLHFRVKSEWLYATWVVPQDFRLVPIRDKTLFF